jgi:peptidoglycan/xylan/chitin deacetylase (PgdA/CDA1 family)
LKLKHAAIIATVLTIVAGFTMISPLYFRPNEAEVKQEVMLSFSVSSDADVVRWCKEVSSILNAHKIGASVFFVGKVAEQYPQIITMFGEKVDIGSQTYNNTDLTSIDDYSFKLEEVKRGKAAVDNAGNLYSRVFRSPFGATDDDIYSLLSRSDILADFSYGSHYNVYQQGQFIKYYARVYEAQSYSPDFFLNLNRNNEPIIINFDNTRPVSSLEAFLSQLMTAKFEFINASELAGLTLTDRGNDYGNSRIASN